MCEARYGRFMESDWVLPVGIHCDNRRGALTLNVTVPDPVYPQIADLAARQQVSLERLVAVLDKVPVAVSA